MISPCSTLRLFWLLDVSCLCFCPQCAQVTARTISSSVTMAAVSTSLTPVTGSNNVQTAPMKTSAPTVRNHDLWRTSVHQCFCRLCVCFCGVFLWFLQLTAAGNRWRTPLMPRVTTPCCSLEQEEPWVDLRTETSPLLCKVPVEQRLRQLRVSPLVIRPLKSRCRAAGRCKTHIGRNICLTAQSSISGQLSFCEAGWEVFVDTQADGRPVGGHRWKWQRSHTGQSAISGTKSLCPLCHPIPASALLVLHHGCFSQDSSFSIMSVYQTAISHWEDLNKAESAGAQWPRCTVDSLMAVIVFKPGPDLHPNHY